MDSNSSYGAVPAAYPYERDRSFSDRDRLYVPYHPDSPHLLNRRPTHFLSDNTHAKPQQRIRTHRQTGAKAGPHVWCWWSGSLSLAPHLHHAHPRPQLTVVPLTPLPSFSSVSSTLTHASHPPLPTQMSKTPIRTTLTASFKIPTTLCLPVLLSRTTTQNYIGSRSVSTHTFFSPAFFHRISGW